MFVGRMIGGGCCLVVFRYAGSGGDEGMGLGG